MARRGSLRIVAGRWRGRRISVPPAPGLRPTPGRLRETLFNWLGPGIEGARVLDAFAGSGALGLEAASRGAAFVLMLERDRRVAAHLRRQVEALEAGGAVRVAAADALSWLRRAPEAAGGPFDLVFLDPPFGAGLLEPALARVAAGGWLAPGGRVYGEQPARAPLPELPAGWRIVRRSRAGDALGWLAAPPAS